MTLRPATAGDAGFLLEMLVEAANWNPDRPALAADQLLAVPELARYVAGWPKPGDFGVVEADGYPLGAAWCRLFGAGEPGYGYVADDVPELSIAVVPGARGRGIGGRLLAAIAEVARARGHRALSLSVEVSNPARQLYERAGYRAVRDDAGAGAVTMVCEL